MQATASISATLAADYMRSIDILSDLPRDKLNQLSQATRMRHFPAGKIIYTPDAPPEHVYMLYSGTVKLYRSSPDGKLITTRLIEAGEIFGEVALLSNSLHGNYAEALIDCQVGVMRCDDFERLIVADIHLAQHLLRTFSQRLNALEYQLAALTLKPLPDRIVAILMLLERHLTGLPAEQPLIRITHEELAHMVGANRENVTKVLNSLQAQGLIELHRGRIKLLNLQQFRSSCQQNVL